MKIPAHKFLFSCVLGFLPLVILVRANTSSAVNGFDPPPSVPTFAGNAQHTAIFQPAAQNLNAIRWTTTIDLNNSGAFAHYGSPLITSENTILVPVKTATDGFQVNAFNASSGAPKYTLTTDYRLPSHGWIPVYNPALTTGSFGIRLYYPGRGGTIYHISSPDAVAHGSPVQEVFYTTLANYQANAAAYNATVFINTPITSDSKGNIFFGFRVQGTAPAPLSTTQSGFARIDANGNGTYVLAETAANDPSINRDSHNSAPALSNDETTLYVVAKSNSTNAGYLIGLDSTTLATKHRVFLRDPRNGNPADITDNSTSSPTVAPDHDVYFGLFGDPANGSRGFLLRFSGDLTIEKTPGGFGWDYTCAIVPATMVPSYQGASTYLIFAKYNNYAFDDGDGINRIALLDPNATQIDPHPSAPGLVEMREVLTMIGPTPDENALSIQYPYAVREWCINTAAVNPATNSIFTPSEDGHIYRWDLTTNSLSQAVELNKGLGQPYVPTIVGPSGLVYTLNGGTLFALGGLNGVGVTLTSSVPDVRTVVVGQSLTFTAMVTNTGPSGVIPSGTVTFRDFTYQNLTPVTTILASNVPLNASGQATFATSSLTAGNGFLGNHHITATYSGDGTFSGGSATLVQKVHARASTTTLNSSPNPSSGGQAVTFTATVASTPAGSPAPSGMVTFQEGATVLAQVPLGGGGTASFNTSNLSAGNHNVTAIYAADTIHASSSGDRIQTVIDGPTPTPDITPTPTPGVTPTPSPDPTPTPTPIVCSAGSISENFDGVTAPALPSGWSAHNALGPPRLWTNTAAASDSGPNAVWVDDPDDKSDKRLDSVPFIIANAGAELSFKTTYALQTGYDGGVLEISIAGDEFIDIIAAGGAFIANGYNGTIATHNGSPIAGRSAWTGASHADGYLTTIVGLPAAATRQTIVLRWRMASDSSGSSTGWHIDTVQLFCEGGAPTPTPVPQALNLSTRLRVQTGENVGIAGFFITGNVPIRVLIRAIGPSLTQSGIPDALADPRLDLQFGEPAFNDNWRDTQEAEIIATGIPPSNDLESALITTLYPGPHTAIISGNGKTSGVALIEVYDLDHAGDAKLANISTRAFVDTGNNIVIAGFILGNNLGENRVVVRGMGPSLTGIVNVLADPSLELRNADGVVLGANNNWQDDPAQAALLTAAGLAPTSNLESGLAATLPPGLYTTLLSGVDNSTGVGLVEIYDLEP